MSDVLTEAQMQASIIETARDFGWLCFHAHDSRRSEPGYPDLTLVRPPRLLFIEVKTADGRLSKGHWNKGRTRWLPGQDTWRDALVQCPGVEYYLCRPSNLADVYAALIT